MAEDRYAKTRQLAREGRPFTLGPCLRCDHPPGDHRTDDLLPYEGVTKFPCVGHFDGEEGRWVDTGCDCPDYVENHVVG